MKAFIVLFYLLLPLAAAGADLTCTVPQANIARGQQLCEDLRIQMRIGTANWSNNKCASEFLRLGMIEVERRVTTRQANATAQDSIVAAVEAFSSTWPPQAPARCGDGTLDTEFGETCDDGNNIQGDGCNDSCTGP